MDPTKTEDKPVINDTEWFVDFLGNDETKKVAEGVLGRVVEESLECYDGTRRKICYFKSHRLLSEFKKRVDAMQLPYKVYSRKGQFGTIKAT